MKGDTLVTVIVPTIGRPKYIRGAINSVLGQDYDDIEVLISDNCPSISTRSILGEALDSRVRIVERDRRYDSSKHMNLCIDDARGYYVMILSDDDLICRGYISSMVSLLRNNEDVVVGLGQQRVLNETDTNLDDYEKSGNASDIYDGTEFTLNHFRGKQRLPIYTYFSLFARKADLLAAGGFRAYPDGSNADNYLFYSLALKGKVGVTGSLMGYRVYLASSGLSTSFENLYLATMAYDKDISTLVWSLPNQPFVKKLYLRILIKISSAHMMRYRLLNIYKARIGGLSTAIGLTRVFVCFALRNLFYGARRVIKPK